MPRATIEDLWMWLGIPVSLVLFAMLLLRLPALAHRDAHRTVLPADCGLMTDSGTHPGTGQGVDAATACS